MERATCDIAIVYTGGMAPDELRAWRTAHGLTQAQLGAALGVTWNAVWRWEHGNRKVPAMVALALRELERQQGTKKAPRG